MECGICNQQQSSKLPFHCATCARNAVYELRLEYARALVEKESIDRQVNAAVKTSPEGDDSKSYTASSEGTQLSCYDVEQMHSRHAEAVDRTNAMEQASHGLKEDISTARNTAEDLRAEMAQRTELLESRQRDLEDRKSSAYATVSKSIDRAQHRWDANHQTIADARNFLAREAANLCGLRQKRRRRPDGSIKEDFRLGGVSIVDLRELNNIPPARVTTALTNVAHLLVLTSHYLSLRLPAEITLPHRDYPLPTIFSPASSYRSRIVPFPGYTTTHSFNSSPSDSRGDIRALPRPRPLYLDKPLPALAKEDPAGYALFIEAVTYLAWDIAWLCRTQGVDIGSDSWESVCSIGRNLWLLLVAKSNRTPIARQFTGETALTGKPDHKGETSKAAATPSLGHFSHGTSHTFLGGSQGNDFMRGWKLSSPMKIVDRLKSNLLGDMTGAEWEVLDERAWEADEAEAAEAPFVLGAPKRVTKQALADTSDAVEGINKADSPGLADRDMFNTDGTEAQATGRTRGWTKLKSRT